MQAFSQCPSRPKLLALTLISENVTGCVRYRPEHPRRFFGTMRLCSKDMGSGYTVSMARTRRGESKLCVYNLWSIFSAFLHIDRQILTDTIQTFSVNNFVFYFIFLEKMMNYCFLVFTVAILKPN